MIQKLKNTKYFFIYYRKTLIIAALILLTICTSVALCLTDEQKNAGGMMPLLYGMVDTIATGGDPEAVAEQVSVTFDSDQINIAGYDINGMGSILETINDFSITLAILILFVTFFVGLINIRIQDITLEMFARSLIYFVIGVALAFNAMTLCLNIANFGSAFAAKIADVGNGIVQASGQADVIDNIKGLIYDDCNKTGATGIAVVGQWLSNVATSIGYLLQLFIPYLIIRAAGVLVSVVCWGRAFEILILSAFSPLAFSELTDMNRFGNGPGSRFLKNIGALALSGAMIVTVMFLCGTVYTAMLEDIAAKGSASEFIAASWNIVVIALAQCGLVIKSNSFAKTCCGVG